MVAEVASIEVTLKLLGVDRYQSSLRGAGSLTEQTGQRVVRSMDTIATSTERAVRASAGFSRNDSALRSVAISALRAETSVLALTRGFTALGAAVGGLAGGVAVNAFKNYADQATEIQNRLAAILPIQEQRLSADRALFKVAQDTRTSYGATANLFSRLTLSSKELGANQAQVLRVVETTQKSLIAGGSTVQEAASVATQLTQALGSGRLAGDELRALAENSPVLIQAIAKEFGVSVGALKDLGSQGQLSADRVFKAILNSTEDVDRMFARTTPTIAAGIQQIDNALVRYIGTVDKSLGATQTLVKGLEFVANNLDNIGDSAALAVAALGGVLGARALSKGATVTAAPFRAVRDEADARVKEAKAAQQQGRFEVQAAYNRLFQARADQERLATTPALALAGPAVVRSMESAEKDLTSSRNRLTDATAALAKAEGDRNALAAKTADATKAALNAQAAAEKSLDRTRGKRDAAASAYLTAGLQSAGMEATLPKAQQVKYDAAKARREELQAAIRTADYREASIQADLDTLPAARVGKKSRDAAARSAALAEEVAGIRERRNAVGLALREAETAATAGEDALGKANTAARQKALAEADRLGEQLVAQEKRVAAAREDVAKKAAVITGKTATGRPQSAETVFKQIEEEIKAQERLAAAEAKSAELSKAHLDALNRAPQASGSLSAAEVRKLSDARAAKQALMADMATMDKDIAAKTAERNTLESGLSQRVRANMGKDAAVETRRGELNSALSAASADRAKLAADLAHTNGIIAQAEETLAERTAKARAGALESAQAAGDKLRGVQSTLQADLANLNDKRKAVTESEVLNAEERGKRLVAIEAQVAEKRRALAHADQAVRFNQQGVTAARDAVTASAGGKEASAARLSREAEAALSYSQRAAAQLDSVVGAAEARASRVQVALRAVGATAVSAFTGLVGMLGGPLGAGLTAISVGLAGYALYQARAAAEVEKHSEALKTLIERTEALNKAEGAQKLRSDRQLVEDQRTLKNTIRSARDERNGVLNSYRDARSTATGGFAGAIAASEGYTPLNAIDNAAKAAGVSMDELARKFAKLPETSEEAAETARVLADVLLAAANADPRLGEKAIEADNYAKKLAIAGKAARDYVKSAGDGNNVTLRTPLDMDGPFAVAPKFDGKAGAEAIKGYLQEIGDEILNLNGTPLSIEGLNTSTEEVRALLSEMANARSTVLTLSAGQVMPTDLLQTIERFKAGKTSSAEFAVALMELREKYPDFKPLIGTLLDANEKLLTAQASAAGLGLQLDGLDGRVVDVMIRLATSGKLPDLAGEAAKAQAEADKAIANQAFEHEMAELRKAGRDAEAATREQARRTPSLDQERFKAGVLRADDDKRALARVPNIRAEVESSVDATSNTVQETILSTAETRLKAQGKEREAALSKFRRENPTLDPAVADRVAGDQFDANEELRLSKKKPAKAKRSQGDRDADTLEKKLRELDQDARVSALDSFDQKTVRFAQDAKVASDQIEAFITAARSGDLTGIPPVMQSIYEKMMLLEGVKLAKASLDEIFPARKLARELQELQAAASASPEIAANLDLIEAHIRERNAPEWITGLSSGVKDAAKAIADGTATIGDAIESLKKRIIGLAMDAAFKPLELGFNSMLSQLTQGASGGASPFGALGKLLGIGGSSPSAAASDYDALAGVPMYATGVSSVGYVNGIGTGTSDSIFAKLSVGESVVTARATRKHRGLIEAMNKDALPAFKDGLVGTAAATLGMTAASAARADRANAMTSAAAAAEPSIKFIVNEAPGGDRVGKQSTRRAADGSLEVVADMLERRSADRLSRNRGPAASVLGNPGRLRGA